MSGRGSASLVLVSRSVIPLMPAQGRGMDPEERIADPLSPFVV